MHEITSIYYGRPRDLTVCLGFPDHNLVQERQNGRYTNYYISFDGIIRSRDLAYTNFSFFTSINLRMELAISGPGTRTARLKSLECFVAEFSELIQDWQSRRPWWSTPSCPRIDVVVDVPTEDYGFLSWELYLQDLADLLKPLGDIDNCDDATIVFGAGLKCGREWVPETFGQTVTNMKREGKDFKWLGENTMDALMWSTEETRRVKKRVYVLQRNQERRRRALVEAMHSDGAMENRKMAEEEERRGRDDEEEEEEEELRMLLLGIWPYAPLESQPDTKLIDLMERFRAKNILNRIMVMVILLDLLVLDS
ncbi:MAG: hypothetical protein LQ339_000774 [Xanthoria mediterranea]|nr:MAG: hypothetical protein LQ339_000774 [Xanthoria mediterranea]